jgi:hypothetical protein
LRTSDAALIEALLDLTEGMTPLEVLREYGISDGTLRRWRGGGRAKLRAGMRARLRSILAGRPTGSQGAPTGVSRDTFRDGVLYTAAGVRGYLAGLEAQLPAIRPPEDEGGATEGLVRKTLPPQPPRKRKRAGGGLRG